MHASRSYPSVSITAAQMRAARALLGWSTRELASRCGVSQSAISRAERVNDTPHMQTRNLNAIRATLEKHGIGFCPPTGYGFYRVQNEICPINVSRLPAHRNMLRCRTTSVGFGVKRIFSELRSRTGFMVSTRPDLHADPNDQLQPWPSEQLGTDPVHIA